jgi:starch synthase
VKAALYFEAEAYSTGGPQLMGRHVAGEQFLRALLRHGGQSDMWALVQHREDGVAVSRLLASMRPDVRVQLVQNTALQRLATPGVLYFPGPNIGQLAWRRSVHGHQSWSLCGVTHTTCSASVMQGLAELVTAPVQPWDAVICTSHSIKDNVSRVLQAEVEHLQGRLGITRFVLPQLPVIPLGVHSPDFAFDAQQRQHARQTLGAAADTLVVLFMGRLSFHAKAHPLAMYQALEAAARSTGRPVLLVECGWFASPSAEQAFAAAARQACPRVQVQRLDGREPANRLTAWAGADVFCSLTDNIQESFGITPIEAMASGLPVVVSDWDGYRDTVRDGVDGFRVPTTLPEPGLGLDLAQRYGLAVDAYDKYCALVSTLVAVDVPATTRAFERLFSSPDLRRRMGDAGRARARETFDWKVIIAQYQSLWAHQNELRRAQGAAVAPPSQPRSWPAQLDPFHAFQRHATQVLTEQSVLLLVEGDAQQAIERVRQLRGLAMVGHAHDVLPTDDEVAAVLQAAQAGAQTALALVQGIAAGRRLFVYRALTWLLKLGVLRLGSGSGG